MGAFPNFPDEHQDQQQQPPEPPQPPSPRSPRSPLEPPPSPDLVLLPEAQTPSPRYSDISDSEPNESSPFVYLPTNTYDTHDYRSVCQYNYARGLLLPQCNAEIRKNLGAENVLPVHSRIWYGVFAGPPETRAVLKESKYRKRSPPLSPNYRRYRPPFPVYGPDPSEAEEAQPKEAQPKEEQQQKQSCSSSQPAKAVVEPLQQPCASSQPAQAVVRPRQQPVTPEVAVVQLLQQLQEPTTSAHATHLEQRLQQLLQQQQELRMMQEDQQNGQQQRRPQWYQPPMEPEINQEPQQEGNAVEVKVEPEQQAEAEFVRWYQKLRPLPFVGLSLSERIDLLVKTEGFITVEEGARVVGISEKDFLTITNNVLHMRRDDQVWMHFDPNENVQEREEMDLFVPNYVQEKIEIGEEFKIKIPPRTETKAPVQAVKGEPRVASTIGSYTMSILKREFPEVDVEAPSTSGLTNGNISIESSNNNSRDNNGNQIIETDNNNGNNNNHENSSNDDEDEPKPSTSFSTRTPNRTSKPNKLSFKGAISDQEPNEKESMSESDDGGLSFIKRTVRRSANTTNKSKTSRNQKAGWHACKYCNRSFKYKHHATRHMNYHCPERDSAEKKRIKCEQCERTFTSNNCKQRHVFFVHQKIRDEIICKRCKRVFDDEEKLKKHQRRNTCRGGHLKDAVCDKCHKRYRDLNSLRRHREKECNKERPYGCAHCDYRTHQKANIIRHFERKHSEVEMKSSCPRCSRVYKNECSLNRHLQYECGKEPAFACDICPYKTKRKFCLLNHMRSQHAKKRR